MSVLLTAPATAGTSGYSLLLADDQALVAAAQKLRHDVFAGELGAHPARGPPTAATSTTSTSSATT